MNYKNLFLPIKKNILSKKTEDDLYSLLKITGENNIYPSKEYKILYADIINVGEYKL